MRPDPTSTGAFAKALLAPDLPTPPGLVGRDGASPTRRFAVYRNNVTVSLVDAMASIFPTVQNLVGEDFFRAMARLYVTAHPPTSPLLFTYGESFPAFLEHFPPRWTFPFSPTWLALNDYGSTHSIRRTASACPSALATIPAQDLAWLRFQPHPATRFARLNHAAGTIVRNDRAGIALENVNPMTAEAVLIVRPAFEVAINVLPPGGATFLETLLAGGTLAEAVAASEPEGGDIPQLIALALGSGAFTSIETTRESDAS